MIFYFIIHLLSFLILEVISQTCLTLLIFYEFIFQVLVQVK